MISAVIFDMDGLLIDSEPFWRQAHIAALAPHGVTLAEDEVRAMAGQRTDEVIAHWRERFGLQHVAADKLERDVVGQVIARVKSEGVALPGVHELVTLLASRGVPMAVASSSAPEVINAVLEKLDLQRHLQFAYSAKHEPFGKPHPGVFLTTAQRLGVSPEMCVVFEDSLSGIRAAKAAGMWCVAVPEPANASKPAFTKEPDHTLATLHDANWELLEKLGR